MDTHTILLRLNQSANRGALGLAALFAVVLAVFAISYHTLPRVERAYQMENV